MALTPTSTTVSYATQADFLLFADANLAGDLVADLGVRTDLTTGTDPVLAMHLLRATGKIESACLKSDMYEAADLSALAAMNPPTASTALLKWMTCALALLTLRGRRANMEEPDPPYKKDVDEFLADIADGKDIFGFAEKETAGIPQSYSMSYQDYLNLNLLTDNFRWWGNVYPQLMDRPRGMRF